MSISESVIVPLSAEMLIDLDRWIAEIAHRTGTEPGCRPEAVSDILRNHFDSVRTRWHRDDARKAAAEKVSRHNSKN